MAKQYTNILIKYKVQVLTDVAYGFKIDANRLEMNPTYFKKISYGLKIAANGLGMNIASSF